MNTHQGYDTKTSKGAKCSKCNGWIPTGHKAVSIEPAVIKESGGAKVKATAIHGILCMSCYEEL